MRAAVVSNFDKPMERPDPEPGDRNVPVRIEVRELDEIDEAVEDVLAGWVTARVVFQP